MRKNYIVLLMGTAAIFGYFGWHQYYRHQQMVIVIPSYNNADWYEKNLSSVFCQDYPHYQVVYIDDNSTDDTYNLVRQITTRCGKQKQVTLIKNSERRGALANIYHAVHDHCPDNAIVVMLDGDDWFAHNQVLSKVARAYQDKNVWVTYGQDTSYPPGNPGHSQKIPQWVIDQAAYRRYPWVTSHLRTCRAWLFKKIKKDDLTYQNDFFSVTWDMALLFPMLEMAAGRIKFIDDVLYVYNMATPLNDYKTKFELQQMCHRYIRNKPSYTAL